MDPKHQLDHNGMSDKAKAAVSTSKQGQVVTGKVTDAAATAPVVPKKESFNSKVFTAPTAAGRQTPTKSNKV